jgi:leucine dehydrogenase
MKTFESLIKEWDGESVLVRHDRPTGAWIFIAVHSTRLGPATGGTRMKQYSGLEDALRDVLRLAAGMTYKWAVPGFERGGGKAVIAVERDLDARARAGLLRRYGELVHQLGGLFYTGPDVGTFPGDMDTIAETGAPYVHSRTPSAGGAGSSGPFTALGVFTGMQVVCEHLFGEPSLDRRRVLVQGVGSVGQTLIEYLGAAGAEVLFSEVAEETVRRYRDELGLRFVPPGDIYTTECDVFAPCALGGVLDAGTIPRLECRAVVGGANNQLSTPDAAEMLKDRSILYAPDYVVNVGGALGITGMESMGWSQEEATKQVVEAVRSALRRVLELSAEKDITTEAAARRIAEERLSRGA